MMMCPFFLADLEKTLGFSVPQNEPSTVVTVQDVIDLLERHTVREQANSDSSVEHKSP